MKSKTRLSITARRLTTAVLATLAITTIQLPSSAALGRNPGETVAACKARVAAPWDRRIARLIKFRIDSRGKANVKAQDAAVHAQRISVTQRRIQVAACD
jgi:hypothetical protein